MLMPAFAAAQTGTETGESEEVFEYHDVDEKPLFPGGDEVMWDWIARNIQYPDTDDDVCGRVIIELVIRKDGSVSDITVIRELHPLFAEEAVRVIKAMPKWTPGRHNGKPVNVRFWLPVTFKLW